MIITFFTASSAHSLRAASLLMIICKQVVDTTDNKLRKSTTEGCHARCWRMYGNEMDVSALSCKL